MITLTTLGKEFILEVRHVLRINVQVSEFFSLFKSLDFSDVFYISRLHDKFLDVFGFIS